MSYPPDPITEGIRHLRDVAIAGIATIVVVLCALSLCSLLGGCESTPEVRAVRYVGEGSLEVITDQGSAGGSVAYVGVYDAMSNETISCPVIALDVTWSTSVGEVDVHARGVPPSADLDQDGAPDIDPRCYGEGGPGPFAPRPRE